MSLLKLMENAKISVRIIHHIALNGETHQYELKNVLNCSYRQVIRETKKLLENGYLRIVRQETSDRKGIERNVLGLTLPGLILLFNEVPELWKHFEEVVTIYRNRTLLPLVFSKLDLYRDANVTIGAERISLLEVVVDKTRSAFSRVAGRRFLLKPIEFLGYEERLDLEIPLMVYFGFESGWDPFAAYCFNVDRRVAGNCWCNPFQDRMTELGEVILRVGRSDAELNDFLMKVVDMRMEYAVCVGESSKKLSQIVND